MTIGPSERHGAPLATWLLSTGPVALKVVLGLTVEVLMVAAVPPMRARAATSVTKVRMDRATEPGECPGALKAVFTERPVA